MIGMRMIDRLRHLDTQHCTDTSSRIRDDLRLTDNEDFTLSAVEKVQGWQGTPGSRAFRRMQSRTMICKVSNCGGTTGILRSSMLAPFRGNILNTNLRSRLPLLSKRDFLFGDLGFRNEIGGLELPPGSDRDLRVSGCESLKGSGNGHISAPHLQTLSIILGGRKSPVGVVLQQ